ncbi:tetratricopeptide repeat protein [uncultured Hymenobacter sp.]|uniref:tetratricopeptide repeat protein n=1 Tax=uncultured Hymenobacter sp. TaxID=170016 RepID=UPI0035C9BCA0
MPTTSASRAANWRSPFLLGLLVLAIGAIVLAIYHYFTGDDAALPVQAVAQLKPVPTTLTAVRVGLAELPIRVNSYLLTQTYDMVGPYVRPEAAWALLGLLAAALAAFLAVVSTLERPAFVASMAGVIFLLMSLNADLLGLFDSQEQYFLILTLAVLGLPAYAFHAFWTEVPLGRRLLVFGVLVAGLSALLLTGSNFSPDETGLHLTSFATLGGAVIVGLLVLWVAFENIQGLLWFNTQAENPASRFGLLPFVASSVLYLGILGMYLWNGGELLILPGVRFDPLVLLLPAVAIGWLGLQRRAASYGEVLPYWPAAAHLYLIFVVLAAGFLGYAFATANDPLLLAARQFTALALLIGGAVFLLYVLVNFGPLIRQRLRVYRVVYEPRRLPLYAVYVLTIAGLAAFEFRYNLETLHQVQAGYYNNLGDLTRLQSELDPKGDALALLAERYYAESDVLDEHNHKASLGRAALYRYRLQRQNEINILRRALSRRPSEKVSLRLAALYNEPADFFDRLAALREGLKSTPTSASLNNDLAQLYTRSTLTDSVVWYLNRAEAAAPASLVVQANRLAYLLQLKQFEEAQTLVQQQSRVTDAAWQSNVLLLNQLYPTGTQPMPVRTPDAAANLTVPEFARLYHATLRQVQQQDTSYLQALTRLAQRPSNGAYFEQLTFLKALMQHYGGQEVLARATLLPLAVGATPSAAYYQNIQGLWLLEQRAYSSAASRLAEAGRNGYTEARLNRVYALALNEQLDSARVAVRAVVQGPDSSLHQPAQLLQRVLTLNFNSEYTSTPDSVKTQFVVLRGNSPYLDSLLHYAVNLTNSRYREVALLAQLPRALQAGQLAAVQQILTRFYPKTAQEKGPTASAWNVVRGELLLRQKKATELRQLAANSFFSPSDQPKRLYYRAAAAVLENQPKQARQLFTQLVQEAPFEEAGILAAANFFTQQLDYQTAYSTLQSAVESNPESISVLKAYTLAAIPMGLTEYATTSLDKLRTLLSPAEYATFRTIYDARRATQDAVVAPWN